jgi:Bifunctional DNA primase/polymerase, N-terminal
MLSLRPTSASVNQENVAALELKRLVDEAFARTARKPKKPRRKRPAPTKLSAFARAAMQLRDHGLAVLPVSHEKKPCVSGFNNWRHRPWSKQIKQWIKKFPDAQVGILCGLSLLTVVDIDSESLLQYAINRWGNTPLIVKTNRGFHLYYRSNKWDRSKNLRSNGLDIDVKAGVAFVMVPPSLNSAGEELTFYKGSWDDLKQLPQYKDSFPVAGQPRSFKQAKSVALALPESQLEEGSRNDALVKFLNSRYWRSLEEVQASALEWNCKACVVPEEEKTVLASVASFWKFHQLRKAQGGVKERGLLLGGLIEDAELEKVLKTVLKRKDGIKNARFLFRNLEAFHAQREEDFAIDYKAMAKAVTIPGMTADMIQAARDALLKAGLIVQTRPFQPKPRRCALYGFPDMADFPSTQNTEQ